MSTPTQKQADLLRRFKYDVPGTFEEASSIIDELAANGWQRPDGVEPEPDPKFGLATAKQKEVLERYDYETEGVTFEEASDLIDQLKANNWQPLD